MSNELQVMQQELMIAKQEAEIMKLRFELQRTQAEKISRLEDSLFSPTLFPHYEKVAATLADSGMVPTSYKGKPKDILVALAMGYQLGFPVEQSLQDIAVINGRPSLWGDGLMALALSHPECESITENEITENGVTVGYVCTVTRKGHQPHQVRFTIQDAKTAGLYNKAGPWTTYPRRMLQLRARNLAIRDKFPDALRGLRIAEIEIDDAETIEGEIVQTESHVKKLKNIIMSHSETNSETNSEVKAETIIEDIKTTDATEHAKPEPLNAADKLRLVTDEEAENLQVMMDDLAFTPERKKKALKYFKVDSLNELTKEQFDMFVVQLGKA